MAGYRDSAIRLGEFQPTNEHDTRARQIADGIGSIAQHLLYGSRDRERVVVNGISVNIGVQVGEMGSPFGLSRLIGTALDIEKPEGGGGYFVTGEVHTVPRWSDVCSSEYCGAIQGGIVLSPGPELESLGVLNMVHATPFLAAGGNAWRLPGMVSVMKDSITGYDDPETPVDPRENDQAMEILTIARSLGHTFLHPALEEYAASLTGPVPSIG